MSDAGGIGRGLRFDVRFQAIEESLKAEQAKGKPLSPEFLASMRERIGQLQGLASDEQVVRIIELSERLEALSSRVGEAAHDLVPRDPLFSPVEIRGSHLDGSIGNRTELDRTKKESLRLLNDRFRFARIEADGHCLFGSIATGLLFKAAQSDRANREMIRKLTAAAREYGEDPEHGEWRTILDAVRRCHAPRDVEEMMRTRDISRAFISRLRALSSAYWMKQLFDEAVDPAIKENFREQIRPQTPDQYLEEMGSMSEHPHWGGEPELIALRAILVDELAVHDAAVVGQPQQVRRLPQDRDHHPQLPPLTEAEKGNIHLFLMGNHYNLLLPK